MTRRRVVACAVAGLFVVFGSTDAGAAPAKSAARSVTLHVHSAAMHKDIQVDVQRAVDPSKPAPTLYLLNGLDGGLSDASWTRQTDALRFLADKQVTVVQPVGGYGSYYADWRAADPVLGLNKWRTFLTEELPPVIAATFRTTGTNAIAGISTSATSVLQLAEAKPGFYQSVASYSGCAQISDPIGYRLVQEVVENRAHGNLDNMYGPQGDPAWAANDPLVHADKLRGARLFISSGSGLPGPYDNATDPHTVPPEQGGLADQIIVGGAIEGVVNACSHHLAAKLTGLGIPATFAFSPFGTHSWAYWEAAFKQSWPILAAGLKLPV